jgi:hypothetical protein
MSSQIDKYDDPNTSANKLILALRNLSFSLDFPVAKLKQAHGEVGVLLTHHWNRITVSLLERLRALTEPP